MSLVKMMGESKCTVGIGGPEVELCQVKEIWITLHQLGKCIDKTERQKTSFQLERAVTTKQAPPEVKKPPPPPPPREDRQPIPVRSRTPVRPEARG